MYDLWVVVPAAGESRRFRDAGYDTPKPLLKIQDSTGVTMRMVTHVLSNLPPSLNIEKIRVGLPTNSVVEEPFYPIITIHHTYGQADSLNQMLQELPQEDPVLVLDCDMVLKSEDTARLMELIDVYDVAIAVTKTFDPNASRVDQVPHPTRFAEKEPISEYGIVGARAFKNIGTLSKALKRTINRYRTIGQEPYLSVAINHCPGTKFALVIEEFVDLGTPERVKESGWRIIDDPSN